MKASLLRIYAVLLVLFFYYSTVQAAMFYGTIEMTRNGNEELTMPDDWRYYFANGHSLAGNTSWKSDNPSVVRVSSSNKFTCRIHAEALAPTGSEANISCSFSYWEGVSLLSQTVYWTVRIVNSGGDVKVTNIALNNTSISLNVGGAKQLTATVSPSDATNKSVTWSSSNEDVASVSSSGLVTAKSIGSTTIVCKAQDGSNCQASCTVTVGEQSDSDESDELAEPTDEWKSNGNYSISWFKKNQKEFTLTTNKELAGLSYLVANGYSSFSGVTIKLGADIDLSGKYWTPIGIDNSSKCFLGSFDGQGHTISGIYIHFMPELNYYGFFGYLGRTDEKTYVKNTVFKGVANINDAIISDDNKTCFYVGGIVGYFQNAFIENCICEMPINFSIKDCIIPAYVPCPSYNIGGIAGQGGIYFPTIKYCKHIGDVVFEESADIENGSLCLGGIIGHGGVTDIYYCESLSNTIKYNSQTHSGVTALGKNIGSICGYGHLSYYNRSVVNTLEFNSRGMDDNYAINCVIGSNCYSSISKLIGKCQYSYRNNKVKLYLSGDASFINSDMTRDFSNVYLTTEIKASESFSSEQMQTPAFLEELNMYSILNMDGPIWTQPVEGGYPYISALYETTAVKPIVSVEQEPTSVFSLSGQRIAAPRKGINIVGGKKVIVK